MYEIHLMVHLGTSLRDVKRDVFKQSTILNPLLTASVHSLLFPPVYMPLLLAARLHFRHAFSSSGHFCSFVMDLSQVLHGILERVALMPPLVSHGPSVLRLPVPALQHIVWCLLGGRPSCLQCTAPTLLLYCRILPGMQGVQ